MQVARYKVQVFRKEKEKKRLDSHFHGNDRGKRGNDKKKRGDDMREGGNKFVLKCFQ